MIDALCDRHVLSPANCFALGVCDIGAQRPRVKPLKFQTETLPIGRVIHFGKKVPAPDAVRARGKSARSPGVHHTQRAGCGANDLTRPYCQLTRNEGGEPHKPTNEKGGPKAIPMIGRKKPRARGGSTAGQAARSGWGARIKRAG